MKGPAAYLNQRVLIFYRNVSYLLLINNNIFLKILILFLQILVWHTQTAKKPMPIVMVRSKATLPGSLSTLLDQVTMLGVGGVSETTGKKIIIY